jgi:PAS domain S-box-containing protein
MFRLIRKHDTVVRQMTGPAAHLDSDNPQSFRSLVEAVKDYAIFLLDMDGIVRTWNIGAERIKGYASSEIVGKHFSIFYPQEAIDCDWPNQELQIAAREGRFEEEGWRVRKDGSKFWASAIISALRDADGRTYGFAKVTRDMTEQREAQRRLQESERTLRTLSISLLRAQDEERRRVGRELHDSIGQYLAMLKMKLDMVQMSNNPPSGMLDECTQLADQTIKEVRTMSYLLYPPMLEENGLKSAIVWFVDGFSKRSGIDTDVRMPDELERLPADIELALFRVLQESLANVHRHSGSQVAKIRLALDRGKVVLEVADEGNGMSLSKIRAANEDVTGSLGVGLRGMTERARQLGGTLDVQSSPRGTTVTATIPIPENHKQETKEA